MEDKNDKNKFDFWQDHSLKYLEMALRTDKKIIMKDPDGYGKRTGECGDTVEIFLRVQDRCVKNVSFDIDGCLNTNACANTVAGLAEGKTIAQAWKITPEKVIEFLETLPEAETHCAELAVGAFYRALSDLKAMKRDPWKRMYKR